MGNKIELTDKAIKALKPAPEGGRYEIADAVIGGLRLRVGPSADDAGKATNLSFVLLARFGGPESNPTRRTLGSYPELTLAAARAMAADWKGKLREGKDPAVELAEAKAARAAAAEAKAVAARNTFDRLADDFLLRHVDKKALRSAAEVRRQLDKYVRPTLGKRRYADIKRRDVIQLLDQIEDGNGPVMADRVLATLSKIFAWQQVRDDEFVSPIVRGMRRTNPRERARDRILADDELQALWAAAGDAGTYGGLWRFALLTGQRRDKVAGMKRSDLADNVWTIATEAREKASAGQLALPPLAMQIINAQPERTGSPYVFAGRLSTPMSGFSKLKRAMDADAAKRLERDLAPYVLHDLRRTAKSLMARAGVRPDISERVLGHTIAGVEGVYDRHTYAAEKAEALAKLADLVAEIIATKPGDDAGRRDADNVVQFKRRAKA
jgi:integrase